MIAAAHAGLGRPGCLWTESRCWQNATLSCSRCALDSNLAHSVVSPAEHVTEYLSFCAALIFPGLLHHQDRQGRAGSLEGLHHFPALRGAPWQHPPGALGPGTCCTELSIRRGGRPLAVSWACSVMPFPSLTCAMFISTGQGLATVEGQHLPPPIYCERESLHSAAFSSPFSSASEVIAAAF